MKDKDKIVSGKYQMSMKNIDTYKNHINPD